MHVYNQLMFITFAMAINILDIYLHIEQLHEGPSEFQVSLQNWL